MSAAISPGPTSSPRGASSQETSTPSARTSPAMSLPSTQINESTLFTTFDSTPSHFEPTHGLVNQGKLGLSLAETHATLPPTSSSSMQLDARAASLSRIAPSDSTKSKHASTSAAAIPVAMDDSLHGAEHGVSPVINALRTPYPPSPSYFITVVPPDDYPMLPESSQQERDRLQRGSLLPLYPTLGGQLWAISREFVLPSVGGLMLYLADDGQGNRGPRIGDAAWQALWSRYFTEDEAASASGYKPTGATGPSRRASTINGDSLVDPSSSSSAHAADLSRSTLGEGSSSRPSISYVSSRPSPRVEALGFSRRDPSADWSPLARSSAWSGPASSSAGRAPVPPAAAPAPLPILARIEWQVDSHKATWWPGWIASRSASRERPSHPTRKSMHLASNPPQSKDAHMDVRGEADDVGFTTQHPKARGLEVQLGELEPQRPPREEAVRSPERTLMPVHVGPSKAQNFSDAMPLANRVADAEDPVRFSKTSNPATVLSEADALVEAATRELAGLSEAMETAPTAELLVGRASPSDQPLRSERASIVSMSSEGSRRLATISSMSAKPVTKDTAAQAESTSSMDARSRTPSLPVHVESSAALLGQLNAFDLSRTGYSEILEAAEGDDEPDHEDSLSQELLSHAHDDAHYSALPDSPLSETRGSSEHPAASANEQQSLQQEGFPLRHSFIVDAGDEALWRDLQHHGMDHPSEDDLEALRPEDQRNGWGQLFQEAGDGGFELVRMHDHNTGSHPPHPTQHLATFSAPMQEQQDLPYSRSVQEDNDADDRYCSPQRSNMARIQSWIGKTPTGRPNSSGGFHDYIDMEEDGLLMLEQSDIDEVVGLWAGKVRENPYAVPHISGPIASETGDDHERGDAAQADAQAEAIQDLAAEQRQGQAGLDASPAPAISLLSPIHLDAAAFGGPRPQLGNLAVTAAPQLLSPTAVADSFNTPRVSPEQRSASTPVVQHHAPSSPASLAPPVDRRPSTASRRSSGDLSDTLEEMQKALELLSPGCSPNPDLGQSPDPNGRKMSSRDSLAYARSISASVTPSPKWLARAKAATTKSRSAARSTFAAGGSPFDRGQVSPRPASTSAVTSRARSPAFVFPTPTSASRLVEFSQADAGPRSARTEVGDGDSILSRDTVSDEVKSAHVDSGVEQLAMHSTSMPGVSAHSAQDGTTAEMQSVSLATPEATSEGVNKIEHAPVTAGSSATEEHGSKERVESAAFPDPSESVVAPIPNHEPSAPAFDANIDDSHEPPAFKCDDHEDGIASIQRFLRGKVVSADSDTSISHDLSASVAEQQPESSADGTIIERSTSSEGDPRSATPEVHAEEADTAQTNQEGKEAVSPVNANSTREESGSNERWSQVSYGTGNLSSHHRSGDSVDSNSPKRDMHHNVRTPSFTYDAHLSSASTTVDSQLSSASADGKGLSLPGVSVKSHLSSSPTDGAFPVSAGPSETATLQQHEQQQQASYATGESNKDLESVAAQHTTMEKHDSDDAGRPRAAEAFEQAPASSSASMPAYRYASLPDHADILRPLAGTHDYSLDEEEIRTMNEDTRAAVREALSQSTAHHVNILPSLPGSSSAPLSPKSSTSPASPLSSQSSFEHFRRRGSTSSLNLTSNGAGSGSSASSPTLGSTTKRRPARLNLDIDGLTRSPPQSSVRRLTSTSPRARFGQLPPSPSLHASYKAATSSPLTTSFPIMGPHLGSPPGKGLMPSLPSVTSIEGELAG